MSRETIQQRLPLEDWHLDERTREVGRRGLAEARAALAAAAKRAEDRQRKIAA